MSIERPTTEQDVLDLSKQYNFYTWSAQNAVEHIAIKGAKGCYFWDYNDTKYFDAASQLVNVNIGFQNEKVVAAIQAQAAELCYVAPSYATSTRGMLGKKIITELVPQMGKVMFTLGGADANEYAIRLANVYTGRYKIFSQYMSYHGSTYGAANLNGQQAKGTVTPGIAGFVHYFGPNWRDHGLEFDTEEAYSAFLLRLLEKQIILEGSNKIAALFLESMQGGGGAVQMPKGYIEGVRALCTKYGILMVCDEVMVGFGRTGKWFTFQHYDVLPDMVTFAKGSTCGYTPLGGLIVNKEIAKYFDDVDLPAGLTYNAHPVCCAAALATIDVYQEERLLENSASMGRKLLQGLEKLAEKHPSVTAPRGLGLMTAVDLVGGAATLKGYSTIKEYFIAKRVIPYIVPGRIIVAPPLIVTAEEIDMVLAALDEVLSQADSLV